MGDVTAPTPDGVTPSRRRISLRSAIVTIAIVVLVWAGAAGFAVVGAMHDTRVGLDALEGLRGVVTEDFGVLVENVGGDEDDVREEDAVEELGRAASAFDDANDRLDSAVLWPARALPMVGRQLRSATALSEAAEVTSSEAAAAVGELLEVLATSSATSEGRIAAVRRSGQTLQHFAVAVDGLDLGPDEGLLPQLAEARNRFAAERATVTSTLAEMTTVLEGVDDFLTGPSDYVIVAANNAEMRAGAGMFLQAGPLEVVDGSFSVGEFIATETLTLDESTDTVDADVAARWGQLAPSSEWRNTNLTPRFDQSAEMVSAMWSKVSGQSAQGVVSVDVPAVARLLELTGPVVLPDGDVISSDTAVEDLLVNQYVEFGDDREARRDRLGQVVSAAFEMFNTQPIGAGELMKVLRELGAGRHLMMWSSVPVQQDAWVALGVDGIPPANSLLLSVLNRGGNKLDPYLDLQAALAIRENAGGHRIDVRVTATNRAPEDLPGYVAGPHPFAGLNEGDYRGIVALTMPSGAGDVEISGGSPAVLGQDGPTRVAGTEIRVRRGESVTVEFGFELPAGWSELSMLPSARVPPITWSADGGTWTDDLGHTIPLEN